MPSKQRRRRRKREKEGTLSCGSEEAIVVPEVSPGQKVPPPRHLNEAAAFVNAALEKGIQGIVAEFKEEKKSVDKEKMKAFFENEKKNRYKDVGCLDHHRVELKNGPTTYIHANYVDSQWLQKKFIFTQAPLKETIIDFWRMVVQEKVSHIYMLCNFTERGVEKCAEYYPVSLTKALVLDEVKVTALAVVNKTAKPSNRTVLVGTRLEIVIEGEKPHKCTHVHWKDWPDSGVPTVDVTPICKFINDTAKKSSGPVVLHCSAGIGRTAVVAMIIEVMETMTKKVPLEKNLLKLLREIRSQRASAVQNELQYVFVHMVLLNYVLNKMSSLNTPEMQKKVEAMRNEFDAFALYWQNS